MLVVRSGPTIDIPGQCAIHILENGSLRSSIVDITSSILKVKVIKSYSHRAFILKGL